MKHTVTITDCRITGEVEGSLLVAADQTTIGPCVIRGNHFIPDDEFDATTTRLRSCWSTLLDRLAAQDGEGK